MDEIGTSLSLLVMKGTCIWSELYNVSITLSNFPSSLSNFHFSIGMFLLWLGFGFSTSLMGQACLSAHDQASGPN